MGVNPGKHHSRWLPAVLTILATAVVVAAGAQNALVAKELKADINRAAGMAYALPVTMKGLKDTPVPEGKQPFYINHYGCPSSSYLPETQDYERPYATFARADSLGKLTSLGRDVLRRLDLIRQDARDRAGELSAKGARQSRAIMRQLVERFPEAFTEMGYYSGRSVVENRCILTMEEALAQLSSMKQPLNILGRATPRERRFMDPQDQELAALSMDSLTRSCYERFVAQNTDDTRLMASLFSDLDYVARHVDAAALSRQLFRLAGSLQHTDLEGKVRLYDLFTREEVWRHWRRQNAWNYINYGACKLNGGRQPSSQRYLLRQLIADADSCIRLDRPGAQLRFGHETVLLPLICLIGVNGYNLETDNFDELEQKGWWCSSVFPMGANVQFVFYRASPKDGDVLVKVLLNEQEATLPIATDCAPYYHWADFRRYCLDKLSVLDNRLAAKD